MAKITVRPSGEIADAWEFSVAVKEESERTEHRVRVPKAYFQRFAGRFATPEWLVRASFAFLLAREPKESILFEFALPAISRYFPEYEETMLGA